MGARAPRNRLRPRGSGTLGGPTRIAPSSLETAGPVAENNDPRLGSTKWADWTNQASNLALIAAQLRLLIPTQEMMPFQRRIFQEFIQVTPAIGQTTIFTWTVPRDESWRILHVSVFHGDVPNLTWTLDVESALDVNLLLPVARAVVQQNILSPLYPSANAQAAITVFRAESGPAVEAYPGDEVQVRNRTPMTAAVPISVRFRWELIPLPLDDNLAEIAVAVSS